MNSRIGPVIIGRKIKLRPATIHDRRSIFEWLTQSDLTGRMMGPPDYPDIPVPSWEQFKEDYKPYFFDGSKPRSGRCYIIEVGPESVGQINHDKISIRDHSTELDIWLKSTEYINKGYGSDAISTLCKYLSQKFECNKFIIAPSERNKIAVRAYEKAGFTISQEKPKSFIPESADSLIMVKYVNRKCKHLKSPCHQT